MLFSLPSIPLLSPRQTVAFPSGQGDHVGADSASGKLKLGSRMMGSYCFSSWGLARDRGDVSQRSMLSAGGIGAQQAGPTVMESQVTSPLNIWTREIIQTRWEPTLWRAIQWDQFSRVKRSLLLTNKFSRWFWVIQLGRWELEVGTSDSPMNYNRKRSGENDWVQINGGNK